MLRLVFTCLALLLPLMVQAQTDADRSGVLNANSDLSGLSDEELLRILEQIEARREKPQNVSILGIPLGFGASRGQAFVSAAATNRRDRGRLGDWDASLALGIGLGDAQTGIGVTPVIEITSVSPFHFGESGKIGVQLSRRFVLGGNWQSAASLDLQNLLTWGDSEVLDREWNFTLSSLRPADEVFGLPVLLSAGYGSAVTNFSSDPGFYAGVGLGLGQRYGISLGWYGDEAIAGANLWLGRNRNLAINMGVGDIFNNIAGRRLIITATIGRYFGGRN